MKNIAIIPARSGSKGLENKNILELSGKPLIGYTIEAAINSKMFDEIYVSTDSKYYAEIAESYGATAKPLRNENLATDSSGSISVILDALNKFPDYKTFCLLQPTSPLRNSNAIRTAYKIFQEKKADSVVSMVQVEKSPDIINTINSDGTITNFLNTDEKKYTRQSAKFYSPNGAIFISDVENFLKTESFYGRKSYPFIMNKIDSVDIDDYLDFKFAEFILKNSQSFLKYYEK